jgi:fructoselysine-6-P-deglycase FrlB-like protein
MRKSPGVGGTLRQMADEVRGQPAALRNFSSSDLPRAPKGSIIVGAGDSYAVALAAFHLSKGAMLAFDPYSLGTFPEIAAGRDVFFVSASGRTSSNIAAARKVRGFAKETVAITADRNSGLARATGSTIKLPMALAPRTPGLLSFTLSLVAALRISIGDFSSDFGRAFGGAEKAGRNVSFAKGTTYFLGNSAAYAVAIYAQSKMHEFFRAKAHAELLEEFSHLELFSLKRADGVVAFGCFDPSGTGPRLCRALLRRGYEAQVIVPSGTSDAEQLFQSVFAIQLAELREARALGLDGPRFLSAKDSLDISDSMIY